MLVLDVILPRGFSFTHLSYIYSGSDTPVVGARVEVPLGKTSTAVGIVCAIHDQATPTQMKEAIQLWDRFPLFPPRTIALFEFLSTYYMSPVGEVLRALVPSGLWRADFAPSDLLRKNRFKKRATTYLEVPPINIVYADDRSVALVHGAMDFEQRIQCLANTHALGGGQTLILVPSPIEARRYAQALKAYAPTDCFHPELSVSSRSELWVRLATAPAADQRIIVATRTGIALPFHHLKRVVVWDESSSRYKNGTAPHYSARDAALVLAARHGAHTTLLSDVPSVESYFNARSNPTWQYIVWAKQEPPLRWISPEHGHDLQSKYLIRRVGEELAAGRRAVVFQNRRGWASAWVCGSCGGAVECPWCRTPATLHKASSTMRCRTCGYRFDEPEACAECGAGGAFQAKGYGTERIAEGLVAQFPEATVARVDSDTDELPTAQIVVCTQKILDEAVDWQGVGLLAVANADNMEVGANFRSSEEAFRLLSRLAARARGVGAEWVLQTRQHDRPIFGQAASDAEAFYRNELLHRQSALYPPFARLIEFEFRGAEMRPLAEVASVFEGRLRAIFGDRLSPLFQPQSEVQMGKYVVKLLLKIERGRSVDEAKERIASAIKRIQLPHSITFEVIVDPL